MPGQSTDPAESDADDLGEPAGGTDTAVSVTGALRHAGAARGLDQAIHPLYAAALVLAARMDSWDTPTDKITSLATELRQYVKVLELDKIGTTAEVDPIAAMGAKIRRVK